MYKIVNKENASNVSVQNIQYIIYLFYNYYLKYTILFWINVFMLNIIYQIQVYIHSLTIKIILLIVFKIKIILF